MIIIKSGIIHCNNHGEKLVELKAGEVTEKDGSKTTYFRCPKCKDIKLASKNEMSRLFKVVRNN